MRLQLYLAKAGIASRRHSEDLIRQGRVSVNDRVVTEMGVRVDPSRDRVIYQGCRVQPSHKKVLIIFHKPAGVLSTMQRGRERGKTLAETIKYPERLFPVGRLDRDTTGLILLTNDGDLAQKLSHPRYEHEKEYQVTLSTEPTVEQIQRLNQPFMMAGYQTRPVAVTKVKPRTLRFILKEGRKRQIREMCHQTKLHITQLNRVRVGAYKLGSLAVGQWRVIDSKL
ncbi:MAG: pseudouridine synthase [Patescibacteria group bacterium]|jgi:23S rRNA pseudouridine2605 synthase/23S rRNA pseudouridine2604 synthase